MKFFNASRSPYLANVPKIDISNDVTAPSSAQTPESGTADRKPSSSEGAAPAEADAPVEAEVSEAEPTATKGEHFKAGRVKGTSLTPPSLDTDRDPYKWSLPSDDEVRRIVVQDKEDGSSGDMSLSSKELFSRLDQRYGRKGGWRYKVEEIVDRKCKVVDNADKNFEWLKWDH
jgi:hypothetical protein